MALGQVTVNNVNLNQAEPTEIERLFLYIGKATKQIGAVVRVNTQSDFSKSFGTGSLVDTLDLAVLNANTDWNAVCVAIDDNMTHLDALDIAMKAGVSVEGLTICDPVTSQAEITAINNQAILILNKYVRRLFVLIPSVGIDSTTQSWAEYIASQQSLLANLVCERVAIVPQLHGNNIGILAGRLANSAVSVVDTPMRVATGALVGLGENPLDKNGEPLDMAVLTSLDALRLSVPQTYEGHTGWYFGDCNLLANETSDYKVIENLRLIDKACRRVYFKLIPLIGDRSVNRSADSIANTTTYLSAPLRSMARATTINGQVFPGEMEPPQSGDIVLEWESRTALTIYISVTPLNCPKKITANLMLDLSKYV